MGRGFFVFPFQFPVPGHPLPGLFPFAQPLCHFFRTQVLSVFFPRTAGESQKAAGQSDLPQFLQPGYGLFHQPRRESEIVRHFLHAQGHPGSKAHAAVRIRAGHGLQAVPYAYYGCAVRVFQQNGGNVEQIVHHRCVLFLHTLLPSPFM